MRLGFTLGAFILSSSLWAGSTTCALNGTSVTDPSNCSLDNGYFAVSASAGGVESFNGNVLNVNVQASTNATLVVAPPPPGPGSTLPSASASAQTTFFVALPYIPANDVYQISFDSLNRGGASSDASLPLSGCTGGADGLNCSFTLSGAQLSPFTVGVSSDSVWSPESENAYGAADVNIAIAQFNQAGDPLSFTPEPAEAGLLLCAGMIGCFLACRQKDSNVDLVTIWRWIQHYAPELSRRCRRELRNTNGSWRVDETYLRVAGKWSYLYRAVDSTGDTIDFLLSPKRDAADAKRFFQQALEGVSSGTVCGSATSSLSWPRLPRTSSG